MSTRGEGPVSLSTALARGLSPDGGLYVFPLRQIPAVHAGATLAETAVQVLAPLFAGESLDVAAVTNAAFTFDAPLLPLDADTWLLEQFHGPTAAFKDFGARFLAEALARLGLPPTTILVATSGDTGAAVAAAFHRRPGFRVVILYPDGRVSARQAHQLGAFGDNVRTFRVAGSFDDCQRLAKEAFADPSLVQKHGLSSANSISLGRLVPQMASYAHASLVLASRGLGPIDVIVPTGNLGNALACLMVKRLGLPIGHVTLATNTNRVLPEFLSTGRYTPAPSVATLANAMDVGAPSNVERLRHWWPDIEALREELSADWVDDETIRRTIAATFRTTRTAVCPHTACGVAVRDRQRARGHQRPLLVAATAHPAKFETIVEPLIGEPVEVPSPLAALLAKPAVAKPLVPTLEALRAALG
ncbi:MAG: threonine synthase [Myxococcaceae bacterium]|nr:threonine synthase [Myxococcaceae bacterium]